jgi:hypothetical protein
LGSLRHEHDEGVADLPGVGMGQRISPHHIPVADGREPLIVVVGQKRRLVVVLQLGEVQVEDAAALWDRPCKRPCDYQCCGQGFAIMT